MSLARQVGNDDMISPVNHAWEILGQKKPSGNRLESKEVYTELKTKLSCAVGADGQRHLLILLNVTDEELADGKSRGLSVVTRELRIADTEPQKYIDITCHDPSGYSAFDLIIEDIVVALKSEKTSPSASISQVLEKWRRFWGRLSGQYLGRADQIGLFSELWFLSDWLIQVQGFSAVRSWQGPFRYRNDFENDDYCVEVKRTTSGRGRIFHVNGVAQLEIPKNGILYFFGVQLTETKNRGQSVADLVSEIREQLTNQYEALSHLEDGLMNSGYNDVHKEIYDKTKFQVSEACLFEVKENFPRLGASTVQIPAGVERIEYEINLNTFEHLIIARNNTEWSPFGTSTPSTL